MHNDNNNKNDKNNHKITDADNSDIMDHGWMHYEKLKSTACGADVILPCGGESVAQLQLGMCAGERL